METEPAETRKKSGTKLHLALNPGIKHAPSAPGSLFTLTDDLDMLAGCASRRIYDLIIPISFFVTNVGEVVLQAAWLMCLDTFTKYEYPIELAASSFTASLLCAGGYIMNIVSIQI